MPSVRELIAQHRTSPATVQRAVAQLVREGLVEARPGRGTFVAARPQGSRDPAALDWQSVALGPRSVPAEELSELLTVPPPGTLVLSSGYLGDELQPLAQVGAALVRAARRPGVWGRIPVEGLPELRAWFARELGAGMRSSNVIICPGSQAALSSAFRALGEPGSPVLIESPTYIGAIAAARAAGLQLAPVPCDHEGVRPDLLADAFAATGARLLYSQPTYANPHGAVLSDERRGEVLAVVGDANAFLLEDDWARDLGLDGDPPPPLASQDPAGHVVYVRSLTKPAAPGLRIGALCARGAAAERLRLRRVIDDFFVAGPLQEATLELISAPAWGRHLRKMRKAVRERRDCLVAAVREQLGAGALTVIPGGGFHLWIRLALGTDDARVAKEAARQGIVVSPGRAWFPAEASGPFLRLTFAAASCAELEQAVRSLAGILDDRSPGGSRP